MRRLLLTAAFAALALSANAQSYRGPTTANDPMYRVDPDTAETEGLPRSDWLWSDWPSPDNAQVTERTKGDLADQLGIDDVGNPPKAATTERKQ